MNEIIKLSDSQKQQMLKKMSKLKLKLLRVVAIERKRYKLEKLSSYVNLFLLGLYCVFFVVGALNKVNEWLLVIDFCCVILLNYLIMNNIYYITNYERNLSKKVTYLVLNNEDNSDNFFTLKSSNPDVIDLDNI